MLALQHRSRRAPRPRRSANRDDAVAGFEAWARPPGSIGGGIQRASGLDPERRFERTFERLGGIRGLDRDTRYELLTLLGRLGVYELRAGKLFLSGENEATWAAKRALGIGDPLLLERRAADLAQACEVPLEALDLAFHNWGAGRPDCRRFAGGRRGRRGLCSNGAQDALGV